MPFSEKVKEDALVACRRHCCVCGKFCGNKIEIHHIKPRAKGGEDSFDNAIPLCFDCHAEVGQYNSGHPKGTKFSESELKRHRDNCYKMYSEGKFDPETKRGINVSPGIYSVKPQEHLYRVSLGQELSAQLRDKQALKYGYDESSTEDQRELITECVQFMVDCIDLVDFDDVSQKMGIDNELNKYIKRLEDNDYWLFIASERMELHGGNGPDTPFPVLNVFFKMKPDESIVKIDFSDTIEKEP